MEKTMLSAPRSTRLSRFFSALGRLIKPCKQPHKENPHPPLTSQTPVATETATSIHPGLSDQHLIVLLTAAACEILAAPVRIEKFRSLANKNLNWVAQGRSELQTHRLK